MSFETALRSRLKDDAGVSALVGTRIDWAVRPQGSALPAIVLTMVHDDRGQHFEGFHSALQKRVQIDCYAKTRAEVAAMREAVLTAIVPQATKSGVSFLRAFVNDVLDRGSQTDTGFIHRDLIDLYFWTTT